MGVEREKCHKIYCPQRPAWIPANQNGCPHCGGTATRAFCICETATLDEIRETYAPAPLPTESEPEREVCPACGKPTVPDGKYERCTDDEGCGALIEDVPAPSETPSPNCGAVYTGGGRYNGVTCNDHGPVEALGIVRDMHVAQMPGHVFQWASETPSPEVGMREELGRLLMLAAERIDELRDNVCDACGTTDFGCDLKAASGEGYCCERCDEALTDRLIAASGKLLAAAKEQSK